MSTTPDLSTPPDGSATTGVFAGAAGYALNRAVELRLLEWIGEGAPLRSLKHMEYIIASQRRNAFEDKERARSDGEKWGRYEAHNDKLTDGGPKTL